MHFVCLREHADQGKIGCFFVLLMAKVAVLCCISMAIVWDEGLCNIG